MYNVVDTTISFFFSHVRRRGVEDGLPYSTKGCAELDLVISGSLSAARRMPGIVA